MILTQSVDQFQGVIASSFSLIPVAKKKNQKETHRAGEGG